MTTQRLINKRFDLTYVPEPAAPAGFVDIAPATPADWVFEDTAIRIDTGMKVNDLPVYLAASQLGSPFRSPFALPIGGFTPDAIHEVRILCCPEEGNEVTVYMGQNTQLVEVPEGPIDWLIYRVTAGSLNTAMEVRPTLPIFIGDIRIYAPV